MNPNTAHSAAMSYARSLAFRGYRVTTSHVAKTYIVEGVKGSHHVRRVYRDERVS